MSRVNLMDQTDRLELLQALISLLDIVRTVVELAPEKDRMRLQDRLKVFEDATDNLLRLAQTDRGKDG